MQNKVFILQLQSAVGYSIWQCQALETTLVYCLLVGNKLQRDAPADLIQRVLEQAQVLAGHSTAYQLSLDQNTQDIPRADNVWW